MASWSEPTGIHSTLQNSLPCHPLPHTPQCSHSASRINPVTRHTHSTICTAHITLKGPELRHLPFLQPLPAVRKGITIVRADRLSVHRLHQTGTVVRVPPHLTLSSPHPERPWFCWLVNSSGGHMIKKELTGGEWKALKNNKTRSELVEKLTIVILQDTIRPSRSKSSFTTHVLHLLFVYRKKTLVKG